MQTEFLWQSIQKTFVTQVIYFQVLLSVIFIGLKWTYDQEEDATSFSY